MSSTTVHLNVTSLMQAITVLQALRNCVPDERKRQEAITLVEQVMTSEAFRVFDPEVRAFFFLILLPDARPGESLVIGRTGPIRVAQPGVRNAPNPATLPT